MIKKLDILHYVLIGVIVGLGVFAFYPEQKPNVEVGQEDHIAFFKALVSGDSLILHHEYDSALTTFQEIDSLYPNRINLQEITTTINQHREEHLTFLGIQEIDTVNESQNTKSQPINHSSNQNSESNLKKEKTSSDNEVESEKGVLHFTKEDGAQIDYIGEIENNKANGYGFAIFEKRGFYEGDWKDNLRHGKGKYYWQNGDIYEGEFLNGKRNGYGVYTFVSGEIYKGHWKDDLRHGEGVLYNKKGKVVSNGPWVQDQTILKKKQKEKKAK